LSKSQYELDKFLMRSLSLNRPNAQKVYISTGVKMKEKQLKIKLERAIEGKVCLAYFRK